MTTDPSTLGAHIPLVYHFAMLQDMRRMEGFREAINLLVPSGGRVLELGGGTGVLSFFAAQKASKVYCVERIPENARFARQFLAQNPHGDRVEVICGDAFEYLPPEPVDTVICEMLHVAMIRERQLEVLDSFKKRYIARFGPKLPRFVPEGFIQAVQPVQVDFDFCGYHAAVPLFEIPGNATTRTSALSEPAIYQIEQYASPYNVQVSWGGTIPIRTSGRLNALRFILKNILAIDVKRNRTVDWHNDYFIVPLKSSLDVSAGDRVSLSFSYPAGCEISVLMDSIFISLNQRRSSLAEQVERIAEPEKNAQALPPSAPTVLPGFLSPHRIAGE